MCFVRTVFFLFFAFFRTGTSQTSTKCAALRDGSKYTLQSHANDFVFLSNGCNWQLLSQIRNHTCRNYEQDFASVVA